MTSKGSEQKCTIIYGYILTKFQDSRIERKDFSTLSILTNLI